MKAIDLLCLDAAMSNLGIALLRYEVGTGLLGLLEMELVQTENESGKQVRRNSDDLRRARILSHAVERWEARANLVAAEVPSGAQSARASFGFGMAVGVLASIRKPLIEVQPTEVKKGVTGRKTASKDEMMEWARRQYPDAAWIVRKFRGAVVLVDKNEHMADAVAIGHTAIKTEQFRGMCALLA